MPHRKDFSPCWNSAQFPLGQGVGAASGPPQSTLHHGEGHVNGVKYSSIGFIRLSDLYFVISEGSALVNLFI
jgi:hypothetical protein